MQRAKRLDKIPPYLFGEIARLKAKAIAEGKDLVDLGIGDPDQPTPQPVIDKLCEAANNPETHRYDESEAGWPAFLESVSRWYKKRFDVDIDPNGEAMLLLGSKDGLAHLCWAMIDPGDVSLVPDPGYTVYKVNTMMAGGDAIAMPLLEENGFVPGLSAIPTDAAKKAKLMFLNYPNNPTGAIATLDFYGTPSASPRNTTSRYAATLPIRSHIRRLRRAEYDAGRRLEDVVIEMHSRSPVRSTTGWRLGVRVRQSRSHKPSERSKSNLDSRGSGHRSRRPMRWTILSAYRYPRSI